MRHITFSSRALGAVLVLAGGFIVLVGINVGFGGILTLGLQGQSKFFEITYQHGYLVQDNHIRFFGGLFGAMGLFLIWAATDLRKFQSALNLVFALIFVGGLARFTMMRPDILFGPDLLGPLCGELVLMPSLYLWLSKVVNPLPAAMATARTHA